MTTLHDEIKLPPLPKNIANIVRRIRACESEVPAQVVLEHCLTEYARHAAAELALASDARIAELEAALEQVKAVLKLDDEHDLYDTVCNALKGQP